MDAEGNAERTLEVSGLQHAFCGGHPRWCGHFRFLVSQRTAWS